MKLITAIIQPDKLDEVREELIRAEIYRITVSRCTGRGQAQWGLGLGIVALAGWLVLFIVAAAVGDGG